MILNILRTKRENYLKFYSILTVAFYSFQTDGAKMIVLEEELKKTRGMLHTTQRYLRDEQVKHNQMVMSLKLELYKTQTKLKLQQANSDKQLSEVIGHLLYLEGRLKKERTKVKSDILRKSRLIDEQKRQIDKLKEQNDQLLAALKELYSYSGMNGLMRECNGTGENSPQNGHKNENGNLFHQNKSKDETERVWIHRGSLEFSSFNVKKALLESERLCSSQENLQREATYDTVSRGDNLDKTSEKSDMDVGKVKAVKFRERCQTVSGYPLNGHHETNSIALEMDKAPENFDHSECDGANIHDTSENANSVKHDTSLNSDSDMNNTLNNSELSNASDVSLCDISVNDSAHTWDMDEDDERIFSFSSTHINSVIAEEDCLETPLMHSGALVTMGSMPMLSKLHDPGHMSYSAKNRPHSLSSVDLNSIQQQAQNLAKLQLRESLDSPTPPPSPSFSQGAHPNRNEKTAFQSFKNMFHRKGSKSKGHKKRSVSLSQTTNKEYTEAMKKHFQKYDMS